MFFAFGLCPLVHLRLKMRRKVQVSAQTFHWLFYPQCILRISLNKKKVNIWHINIKLYLIFYAVFLLLQKRLFPHKNLYFIAQGTLHKAFEKIGRGEKSNDCKCIKYGMQGDDLVGAFVIGFYGHSCRYIKPRCGKSYRFSYKNS